MTLRDERVRQPAWSRIYVAPSYFYGERKQVHALEVLSDILGGGATSRLYRQLVVENKLAVSAGAYYSPRDFGPSQFGIYASPRSGVSTGEIEAAIDKVLTDLVESGITESEVDRAKNRILAEAVYARDSLRAGARVLGAALATGLTVDDVENWPDRISEVTQAGVDEALRSVFVPGHSVTAELLPEKSGGQEARLP